MNIKQELKELCNMANKDNNVQTIMRIATIEHRIEEELDKLEKIKNVNKMWNQVSRKVSDCEAMCKIDSILNNNEE